MADDHFALIKTKASRKAGIFSYDLTWEIKVDIQPTQVLALADAIGSRFAGLPNEGNIYPGNPLATCREISVESVSKGGVYNYMAKYTTEGNRTDDEGETEVAYRQDPTDDVPRLRWVGSIENRAIHKDRDDEGILNTAGDQIIETHDDNIIGASVTVNVASVPLALLTLRNTCNENALTIGGLTIPAEVARVVFPSSFISEQKTRNDVNYFELSYDLLFDPRDTHYRKPLNAGFRELVDGDLKKIISSDGSEVTEPQALTVAGARIEAPTPENVNYLDVKIYPTAQYTAATLPGIDRIA